MNDRPEYNASMAAMRMSSSRCVGCVPKETAFKIVFEFNARCSGSYRPDVSMVEDGGTGNGKGGGTTVSQIYSTAL